MWCDSMDSETTAEPSDLVRRWFEDLFTEGDLAVAGDILAEDVEYCGPPSLSPTDVSGPTDIREFVEVYRTAFPDLRYTVEQMGTSDETLLVRWTAVGTHESDFSGWSRQATRSRSKGSASSAAKTASSPMSTRSGIR